MQKLAQLALFGAKESTPDSGPEVKKGLDGPVRRPASSKLGKTDMPASANGQGRVMKSR
jgi:hypothetical protein